MRPLEEKEFEEERELQPVLKDTFHALSLSLVRLHTISTDLSLMKFEKK